MIRRSKKARFISRLLSSPGSQCGGQCVLEDLAGGGRTVVPLSTNEWARQKWQLASLICPDNVAPRLNIVYPELRRRGSLSDPAGGIGGFPFRPISTWAKRPLFFVARCARLLAKVSEFRRKWQGSLFTLSTTAARRRRTVQRENTERETGTFRMEINYFWKQFEGRKLNKLRT
ncbi:hypothetical protein K0M31_015637 [Melipona bicolor]|uniref:Uncharacterized protein n=1 Tax=Melipona bicolor TaxID=60889 RepID=A0AA40FFP7_9HYME|nr:hypothetical protein K0M31_015637 [Melipona bicolor]